MTAPDFSYKWYFSIPSLEVCFLSCNLKIDHLNKVKTKLNNVIKSSMTTLNSKDGTEKLKIKEIESVKNQNTERRKPSFSRRI